MILIDRDIELLLRVFEQLYPRFVEQTTVGVIWTLLVQLNKLSCKLFLFTFR